MIIKRNHHKESIIELEDEEDDLNVRRTKIKPSDNEISKIQKNIKEIIKEIINILNSNPEELEPSIDSIQVLRRISEIQENVDLIIKEIIDILYKKSPTTYILQSSINWIQVESTKIVG